MNRNGALFNTWLDATLNFQRLKLGGLPIDIDVTYINPYCQTTMWPRPVPQLYRLRDLTHETHLAFLAGWFPTATGTPPSAANMAITYENKDRRESARS